jgi:hypothetical protein
MTTSILKVARRWSVFAALVAGLTYSLLALKAQPAYASSCDCNEAVQDAFEYCLNQYGVGAGSYTCPFGPNQDEIKFACQGYFQQNYRFCSQF